MADINVTIEESQPINVTIGEQPINVTIGDVINIPVKKHSELDELDYESSGHTGFAPALGDDDNYVTDAEKIVIGNTFGVNTGDQDLSGYEPLLPLTPADPEMKYLNGNRVWSPVAVGGGGFAGNLYYTTIPSDIPGYYKLSYTPQATETILSGVVQNNEVLFRTYLFDLPIDTTVIDGGVWGSVPWLRVSNATGVTRVKIELFVRHTNGTETTLFSGYTEEINSTTMTRFKSETSQPSFTVLATDRLGARVYGTTTSGAPITIYSVVGDGNASYFTTPLRIRHDQLRDLNGDAEYQHMTAAEKTIVDGVPTTYLPLSGGTMTGTLAVKPSANSDALLVRDESNNIIFRLSNAVGSSVTGGRGWIQATNPTADAAGAGILFSANTTKAGLFQLDSGGNMVFRNRGNASSSIYFDTNTDVIFRSGTGSALTTMTIKANGNIGIGTTSPNANAILDVSSTSKAFMPPRMTTVQRDAIASPTAGMVIYNTTTNVLNFHNGTTWGSV